MHDGLPHDQACYAGRRRRECSAESSTTRAHACTRRTVIICIAGRAKMRTCAAAAVGSPPYNADMETCCVSWGYLDNVVKTRNTTTQYQRLRHAHQAVTHCRERPQGKTTRPSRHCAPHRRRGIAVVGSTLPAGVVVVLSPVSVRHGCPVMVSHRTCHESTRRTKHPTFSRKLAHATNCAKVIFALVVLSARTPSRLLVSNQPNANRIANSFTMRGSVGSTETALVCEVSRAAPIGQGSHGMLEDSVVVTLCRRRSNGQSGRHHLHQAAPTHSGAKRRNAHLAAPS